MDQEYTPIVYTSPADAADGSGHLSNAVDGTSVMMTTRKPRSPWCTLPPHTRAFREDG